MNETSDGERVRVLLADDHPIYRDGLMKLLTNMPNVSVVGEAQTGTEAVAAAAALQPDVVVMDLQMPELSGIDATRRIVQDSPHIAVLVLTMYQDDASVFAAMRAGARGYLLKTVDHTKILRAIEAVVDGEAIFSPGIAERVLAFFAEARTSHPEPAFPDLTERERDVLELIAAGRNNQFIGTELRIAQKTVRNHVSNIFMKLQVADRAQAIVRAREAGFGRR
jgi:DNA-binding NarL/FixJ family response regulator